MAVVSEPTEVDLESLVRRHQADVWRYLRYLGASASDADDLTQETFLAVARAEFKERSPAETAGYLRTVARNQLLMARRRAGREVSTVGLEAAEQAWAETVGTNGMDRFLAALDECLEHVEGRARQAVEEFYREGRSREEVAAALDMEPEGVKTLLRRTRDVLRDCIERRTRDEHTSGESNE